MTHAEWENNEKTIDDANERSVLFGALDSFYQYAKVAHYNTTHLRRQSFYALPRAHIELLNAPPFFYLDTLIAVDVAIDNNAELSEAILQSGLLSFGIDSTNTEWQGKASSNDLEKARSTLRQFYRDWSKEGSGERAACYNPVIEALKQESSARSGSRMRVLVPGAGLGRLVFELCCAGFHTEGNEISFHQLLASSYILNICPEANKHELHPFVHTFSNHLDRNGHLKSVRIPDVHPGTVLSNLEMAGEMSMSASDFLMLYSNGEQQDRFDAVATVFFLDTSPNIIRYFEAIRNCLKKGGLLINIGPLLWHFENNAPGTHLGGQYGEKGDSEGIGEPGSFELTDDEVMALLDKMGFDIEKRQTGLPAPYIQDPDSMLQSTYRASHWVARKR